MQFTTAAAQSVAIQRCLQEARVNASRPAASAATLARTALLAGNATAAASAIQSALCSADTATATAEAFAEVISSDVGCNGTVRAALQCKPCLHNCMLSTCITHVLPMFVIRFACCIPFYGAVENAQDQLGFGS